jgi:hypothetical protein
VVNTAPDAGSVDVYLIAPGEDPATVQPIHASVASEQASAFSDPTSGNYRVRVTAADDRNKLLLDLPSVTFGSQQVLTLVLSRSTGGVLVHGLLLAQQGAATAQRNPSMRVRLVAAATGSASVTASIGGTVVSAVTSPAIGNYVLVPAGVTTANITAGGNTVAAGTLPTTTGGEDLTLLVTGAPTAATAHWLSEDNRLPTGTSRAVVRLVHGINNVGQLTMTVDGEPVASGLTLGQSAGASVASGTNQVQITSPTPGFTVADNDEDYTANGVYTVFVLGDSPTTPSVQERRSR